MAKAKQLTPGMVEILTAMGDGNSETIANMKDRGVAANPSQLKALENRGFVSVERITVEVPTIVKREIGRYTITDAGLAALAALNSTADSDSDE